MGRHRGARGWLRIAAAVCSVLVAPACAQQNATAALAASTQHRRAQGFDACAACKVEVGTAPGVTHDWTTITTSHAYLDPVILMGIVTIIGPADAAARMEVVSATQFRMKVVETDCQDGSHAGETISWMIMESSTRAGAEAAHVELGYGSPGLTGHTQKVVGNFDVTFTATIPSPIVITTIMSNVQEGWYTGRGNRPTDSGFELMLQEEESRAQEHVPEIIGYLAVTDTGNALGSVGGFEYWASETGDFDEEGRDRDSLLAGSSWYNVDFGAAFQSAPHVFGTISSPSGSDPVMIRGNAGWTTTRLQIFVRSQAICRCLRGNRSSLTDCV